MSDDTPFVCMGDTDAAVIEAVARRLAGASPEPAPPQGWFASREGRLERRLEKARRRSEKITPHALEYLRACVEPGDDPELAVQGCRDFVRQRVREEYGFAVSLAWFWIIARIALWLANAYFNSGLDPWKTARAAREAER